MFSTTLKKSVATLGVVAGLLAAAGPASAMPLNAEYDGMEGGGVVSRPDQTAQTLPHEGAKDTNALIDYEGTTFDVKAAVSFGAPPLKTGPASKSLNTLGGNDAITQAREGLETLKADSNEVAVEGITLTHEGYRWTRVLDGNDGDDSLLVKSPASAEVFELNTLGGNDALAVRGTGGDDTFAVRGTQVGSEGVKAPTQATPSEVHVPIW